MSTEIVGLDLTPLSNGEWASQDVLNRQFKQIKDQLGDFKRGVSLTTGNIASELELLETQDETIIPNVKGVKQLISEAVSEIDSVKQASETDAGIVKLSDSVTSTSKTMAATANSVRVAYERANSALDKANSIGLIPDATTTIKGIVSLSDSITSDSSLFAATPRAVKEAIEECKTEATTEKSGIVRLTDNYQSNSKTTAITPNAVKELHDLLFNQTDTTKRHAVALSDSINSSISSIAASSKAVSTVAEMAQSALDGLPKDASLIQKGIVVLSDRIDDDNQLTAATSKAVKAVNDRIDEITTQRKWYDVTKDREMGKAYTNNTGNDIDVIVDADGVAMITVDNLVISKNAGNRQFTIPNGSKYVLDSTIKLNSVLELR